MLIEAQQALIAEPPEKCPYFTLPDVRYLIDEADIKRRRIKYVTVVLLWGTLAKMTDESQAAFLLALLKHSKFEPDWQAVAKEWNLAGPKHIKSRFKAIVESHKYSLENDSTITGGELPQPNPGPSKMTPPNQTITSSTVDGVAASSSVSIPVRVRKRKVDVVDNEEDSEPRRARKAKKKQAVDGGEEVDEVEAGAKTKAVKAQPKQKSKKAKGKEKEQAPLGVNTEVDDEAAADDEA